MEESRKQQVSSIKKKRKPRNNDDSRRWSDLPNELLESIKKRLFYADQLNFRVVCKSWSCIGEEERLIPPLQQMPWLLFFYGLDNCGTLIDPKYKTTYKVDITSIKKKMNMDILLISQFECHESKYGWLLISSKDQNHLTTTTTTALFLYSPFLDENNNCIELPILNTDFCMATFTSNPLDDDCTVITLNTSFQVDALVIKTYHHHQGRHSSSCCWVSQVFKCDQFSPSHVKCWTYTNEGIFYYVIRDGRVGTFDLAKEEWKVFPPLPTTMQATLQTLLSDDADWVRVYMIKSSQGELFLISEYNLRNRQGTRWYYNDQYIYRLDLSSMIWEDLNNIGERVLFIGNGYKAVLNSSDLKNKGEQKEMSNSIYCCSNLGLKYCTVHDYTLRNSKNGYPRRQQCSRHYGGDAMISSGYIKLLIDPPLPGRPRWLVKSDGELFFIPAGK